MTKLLWVALPLLLAAGWVALQALRGRTPSRLALNVGSSVLLLAYVLATAGLGIFWVANQQLPVFDWHYLFGYGTVLLVTVHLVFNFGAVWRYLTRPRPADGRLPAATHRRGALGAIGAVLATGVAFALGLRQGRGLSGVDLGTPVPGASGGDPAALALARVDRFHAFSSQSRAGVFLRAPGADWGAPPPPFKRYPGTPRVALPAPGRAGSAPLGIGALATVLWHSLGVSEVRGGLSLRTSPSSGALFATELYVMARAVPGLAPGLWHYEPQTHALERIAALADEAAFAADDAPSLPPAAALVVATAVFRRTGHKYGDRTYRYVLADLGHALENLRVAGDSVGIGVRFLAAFDEARTADALGLDQAAEGVLAVAALRPGGLLGASSPAAVAPMARPSWQAAPAARDDAAALGATATIHAATSLRAIPAGAAAAPRREAAAAPLPPDAIVLPHAVPAPADMLRTIASRRSVRRFARTPLSRVVLAGVLARLADPGAAKGSPAIRIDVVVHAVDGVAPGAYRYEPAHRALVPRRVGTDLRRAARAAALDQDVIGEGAVVFVLSIDRAAFAADPLGAARGYRHAFLEAGRVGERVYLEAGARGLGACAVGAFYDDEAAALVGVDTAREWVVHFASLGVPA